MYSLPDEATAAQLSAAHAAFAFPGAAHPQSVFLGAVQALLDAGQAVVSAVGYFPLSVGLETPPEVFVLPRSRSVAPKAFENR